MIFNKDVYRYFEHACRLHQDIETHRIRHGSDQQDPRGCEGAFKFNRAF